MPVSHRSDCVRERELTRPRRTADVHTLVDAVLADPDRFKSGADSTPASFIIVTHNTLDASREWFAKVLHAAYEASAVSPKPASDVLGPHFSLFPDPSRALAKAFGVGNLSTWGALFGGETFSAVGSLKEKGIVNLTTGGGSDRWATHGAVAVDAEGKVRWWWKAETASAEGDFIEALKALEI